MLAAWAAGAIALAGCNAICLVAPCDSWTPVMVANDCGYDVEAAWDFAGKGPPSYADAALAPGESADIGHGDAKFDVWVRLPSSGSWPVVVRWADIDAQGVSKSGNYDIDLTAERCPH